MVLVVQIYRQAAQLQPQPPLYCLPAIVAEISRIDVLTVVIERFYLTYMSINKLHRQIATKQHRDF